MAAGAAPGAGIPGDQACLRAAAAVTRPRRLRAALRTLCRDPRGSARGAQSLHERSVARLRDPRSAGGEDSGRRARLAKAPWRERLRSIVLALTLALLGCSGDDEPTLTGTWTGTIQDSVAGTGTALFTFSQTGANVNGTWQFTFQNPANNNGGSLSGTAGNPAIALTLFAAQSQACSFTVVANFDEDDHGHFTGTYTARNCSPLQDGNLDVHRQ